MNSKRRAFIRIGAAALAATAVAGGVWTAQRPAAAADFELAMVIKETTNPYYNATLKGAQIAASEIGGTAKNYGPTQSSPQAQIEIINNLADRHIPAIAIAPSDPNAVVPAMKRAARLGSKVITYDADSAPEGRPFFVNQATTESVGKFGAEKLAALMGDKGKVAIVSAQPTAANQNAWIAAFRDEMKKHPGIQIVDEVYGYDNEQKAYDLTVALTTKYPDLGGLYAPTCPGLPAVARALESVNKGKGVIKLAGLCVPSITAKYMLDGTIGAFYLWDPVKLGYITFYAAKLFAEGKIRGQPGDTFTITNGKWPGTYKIGDNHEIVTGQPLQFNEANLKENEY
ncbi:MAG: substrate-binding domain-containing protein [Alphaproteobacteria bacterium]|nr:substrate-binding domain-containing protein [Alphaproteobacteria bacterium]